MKRLAALLLLSACPGDPAKHTPDASVSIDAAPLDAPAPSCTVTGPVVHHAGGAITAAETWAANTTHVIDGDILVEAPVTIASCARIALAAGTSIEVRANGTLQPPAGDTAPSGIAFVPLTTAWSRIRINGGAFLLNGASITGGGLRVPGALTMESGQLLFQGLTITGSTNLGLQITGGSLAGSTALTITGSTAAPVQLPANMVGQLPIGAYTGNAKDEVVVPTTAIVSSSQTWHDLGVPYHLQGGGRLDITGSSVPVLTLDPGTTLAFDLGGELNVDTSVGSTVAATGALHAVGTPTLPITFTSSGVDLQGNPRTKAAGDWQAIYFGGAIDANTQIDHARIEFAGAAGGGALGSCNTPSNNTAIHDAAVRFRGGPQPAQEFITNTDIADCSSNGFDRSYAASSDAPDFTLTNTFDRLPATACAQTHPRINNACPATNQCD